MRDLNDLLRNHFNETAFLGNNISIPILSLLINQSDSLDQMNLVQSTVHGELSGDKGENMLSFQKEGEHGPKGNYLVKPLKKRRGIGEGKRNENLR